MKDRIKEHRELRKQQRKRIERIMALSDKGVANADIARKMEITRQRVGQIIRTEKARLAL